MLSTLLLVSEVALCNFCFLSSLPDHNGLSAHQEPERPSRFSSALSVPDGGKDLPNLSTATIRTVAAGVIGIACIQALIIGLALVIAGIPLAGLLSMIVLVLGIAQIPALLVTLPVIGYIWYCGDYGTSSAISYTILLLISGMADNVLKPLMLGRGVDAPMPVILLGALGGMATKGILGMFIGATLLALGYQIFMWWVAQNADGASGKEDDIKIAS